MKFYHVDNIGKGAKSHWLIAKDETDAIRIASTERKTHQSKRITTRRKH